MYGAQLHLITVERREENYWICFYTNAAEEKRTKISATL
jgi:hypothetical protein